MDRMGCTQLRSFDKDTLYIGSMVLYMQDMSNAVEFTKEPTGGPI
jgi:hypothetical protein